MIKPTTLVFLATFFSSSLAATRPSDADASHANTPVGSGVRRAAAAGVPSEERKLQQNATVCYQVDVPPTVVPCSAVTCTPSDVCYTDQDSCLMDADYYCSSSRYGYIAITNPNTADCAWMYACCPGP
jgi:hypothetical protein